MGASTRPTYISKISRLVAPSTASDGPFPPCSCSKAASYSCRGCGAPSSKPSLPSWPSHINEKERCLCPSHLQTPADEHRGCQLPSPSRPLFATHPVPAPPQSVFLAEAHPLEEPLEPRDAQELARHALQKAASVSDGGRRTLMDVLFEQSLDGFIRLGWPAAALAWL